MNFLNQRPIFRSIGQSLSAALIAAMFVILPVTPDVAQASGDLGWNSEIDYYGSFDGTSTYASASAQLIPDSGNFTVESWVSVSGTATDWQAIATQNQSPTGTSGFFLGISSGVNPYAHVAWSNAGTWAGCNSVAGSVPIGSWVHVAAVFNGSAMSTYVNGNLAAICGASSVVLSGSDRFFIGTRWDDGGNPFQFFTGGIDQVKVWTSALSQTQIASSMHIKGAPAGVSSLLAEFDFNEGSGPSVFDRTANTDLVSANLGRVDVKQTKSVGSDVVLTFPRTYLPGVGGWTVPGNLVTASALAVAGGGAGGSRHGGGGGAGGLAYSSDVALTGTLNVVVGQGGLGATSSNNVGSCVPNEPNSGQNSKLGILVEVIGGGRGGSGCGSDAAESGGSSGALPNSGTPPPVLGNTVSGDFASYGNAGGVGYPGSGDNWAGGGGGGAMSPGFNSSDFSNGGAPGGAGFSSDISGTAICYAAGGGGGVGALSTAGAGSAGTCSSGVVTAGAGSKDALPGGSAKTNSGSGGGGSGYDGDFNGQSGDGGSGVVIIRYTPQNTITFQSFGSAVSSITSITGSAVSQPAHPTTTSEAIFLGWTTTQGEPSTLVSWNYTPTSDVTLYGLWRSSPGLKSEIDYALDLTGAVIGASDSPELRSSNEFTIQMWVKPTSDMLTGGDYALLAKHYDYAIVANSGTWQFYTGTTTNVNGPTQAIWQTPRVDTGVRLVANAWTHIALVYSGTTAKFFVDGIMVKSTSKASTQSSSGELRIGDWTATPRFKAEVDEIRMWNSDRSNSMAQDMHTKLSGRESDLAGYWDFNEGSAATTYDRVGINNLVPVSGLASIEDVKRTNSTNGTNVLAFPRTYLPGVGGWTVPTGVTEIEALVVAGGGGGGSWVGAGGGAGGFVETSSAVTSGATFSIQVGQGGLGGLHLGTLTPISTRNSAAGQSSTISPGVSPISALGGGNGAGWANGFSSGPGGSGGGGNGTGSSNQNWAGSAGLSGQGFAGGNGEPAVQWASGGGGGAGSVGGTGSGFYAGDGGSGSASRIVSGALATSLGVGQVVGDAAYFAGGGGGGYHGNNAGGADYTRADSAGTGGVGGGGNGAQPISYTSTEVTRGQDGLPTTGGGGGGAGKPGNLNSYGGSGGSGVVVLSYNLAPDTPTSLTATQTTTHATVNLSWTAPAHSGASALTDYDIEYKPTGGSWTSYSDGVSTATTATVQLPQQCISHEFRVIAKNSNYSSVASATASATPVWGTFDSLTGVQIGATNSECVVSFTSVGNHTWSPPSGTSRVAGLLVGGGGGGGGYQFGGGGGAGGVVTGDAFTFSPGSQISIVVGAGGTGGQNNSNLGDGGNGGESRLWNYIAAGGGGGLRDGSSATITPVGSTGGNGAVGSGAARSPSQADYGGLTSYANPGGTQTGFASGGGGGGAGGSGTAGAGGINSSVGGNGGPGISLTVSGQARIYAAGGGGGGDTGGNAGDSSAGRGGFRSPQNVAPFAAQSNSGSGGGGVGQSGTGAAGGSGIVIIRQLTLDTPFITAHPQNAAIQPGNTETLSVTATGNGALSYQWQSSTNGTSWNNVGTNSSSFTSPTLTLADDGIQYRVIVTNSLNGLTSQVTSNVATIAVSGVTITAGACSAMVGSGTGVTISETANGACLVEYTSPGNNSFFVPSLVSSIQAFIVGGGGGGGGAKLGQGGGGGGGGAASRVVTLAVTGSQTLPISIGAGGAGGSANSNGQDGGSTSISSSNSVPGGRGGKAPTSWPGGAGEGGTGGSSLYASSGGSGGNGVTDPGDRSYYQPRFGNAGSSRTFAGEFWCVGGGGGGGNREVSNDVYFQWEPRGQFCSDGTSKPGGSGGWHNGTTNVLPTSGDANRGGGGGGGSYNSSTNAVRAGAAGADGVVAIYYVPSTGEISLSSVAAASYSGTTHAITLTKDNPATDVTWTTSNTAVCTISGDETGATVTELAGGLCEVSVVVAASSPYARGTSATSFQIDKITRTAPTWTNNSLSVPFGGTIDLRPRLSSPGSNAYTFSTSGTVGSCSVTGYTLNVGDVGDTCNVRPTLVGDETYLDVDGTQLLSVTVTKISQSALVITSATTMNVNQTLTLSAAGGSGTGALSYIVANQGNTGCVADPTTGVLSATAAGQCEVYAKRATSTNYDQVTSSHVVVTINKVAQNLSWVSQPEAQYVVGNLYSLEATASSQLTVAYSISSGLCQIENGNDVRFTGSGDCVIEAGQSGDDSFLPAVTISQTVSVGKINQTMTFSALANISWGSLAFSLSATASSGLNIAYSENNQTTNDACDVSSTGIVTIKNVGTCAVTAAQAGDSAYTAVTTTRVFEVTANQAGAPFIGSVSFGDRQLNASFFTPSYLGGGTISAFELRAYELDGTLASTNTGCIANQGATQSCSVIGLDNGKKYVLKVAAITQAGLGELSVSSSEIIPAANPEAVGNLIAIEGNGTLSLQWTEPPSFGGGNFFQYRIYWRAPGQQYQADGSPGVGIGTQSSTSYVITGLTNGVAYDVKIVTATSNNNVELQSNTAEVRQTPFTIPDAPASVVALDNGNTVVIAWQPPTFDGGNPIDQYVVKKGTATVCTITSVSTTSCEVAKPAPGTSTIEVRAGNEAGLSLPAQTTFTVQSVIGGNNQIIAGSSGTTLPASSPSASRPIVTDVSGSAVVSVNDLIKLVGTNMRLVDKVLIGDIEASFFVNSDSLITIRIPVGVPVGNVVITLAGEYGSVFFTDLLEVKASQQSVDEKVTIGTFLGFAAVYTKNHEGKRLSMRIGSKWRVIDPLDANYTYNFTKVGVGKTVTVMVYIDRELVKVQQIKIQ